MIDLTKYILCYFNINTPLLKIPYTVPFIFLPIKAAFLEVESRSFSVKTDSSTGLKKVRLAKTPSAMVGTGSLKITLGFMVIQSIKSSNSNTEFTAPKKLSNPMVPCLA